MMIFFEFFPLHNYIYFKFKPIKEIYEDKE